VRVGQAAALRTAQPAVHTAAVQERRAVPAVRHLKQDQLARAYLTGQAKLALTRFPQVAGLMVRPALEFPVTLSPS